MSEKSSSTSKTQQEILLSEVEAARRDLLSAKVRWYEAVIAAHKAGISNGRIGGRSNLTEAAIRILIKREKSGKK